MSNEKHVLAHRDCSPLAIPEKGFVVINGQKHFVDIQPIHRPKITQPPGAIAHYQLAKDRADIRPSMPKLQMPSSLSLVLAAITMLTFAIAVSMASIGLTAYSNSVQRTDRLQRLIYVEPGTL